MIIGGSNHMERRLNQNNSNKNSSNLNTSLNPNAAEFVPSSHRNPNPVIGNPGNGNPGNGNPGNTNPGNGNPGIGSINIPEFIPASLRSPKENGNTGISNSGFGNPNAPEFVPSFMRNQNPGNQITVSKSLDRSDSNKTEDEMRQYWQLPDDITPDFNTLEDKNEPQTISLTNLSINESGLEGTVDRSMWGKQYINGGKQYINGLEASGSELRFGNNGEDLNINNNNNMNPMKFLNLKYPGFSNPALFEVFMKSGRDLSLAMEVLNEIESQNKSKSFVSPNMITLDSPNLFRSLSTPSRRIGDSDLLNDINNNNNINNINGNNNNNQWRFNRGDASSINHIGSSRLFRNLSGINSSFKSNDDVANGSLGGSTWLETGDNIGNLHLESKEEVRNLALLRNVCLEQARQAYLAGNDSLSKELTLKGQLYNMQIKASQEKAKEALSQHNRSLLMCDTDDRLIDLRGLHASEAIHVLNYELNSRKRAIRGTGRRLETNILVGLAAPTRGGGMRNNPGRLLGDVEQFLFEHGFRCTQPHPGLLRVVMY